MKQPTDTAAGVGKSSKGKLTAKQRLFAEQYLIDLNGTKAAIRAGYAPKNAEVQAHHLLKKPQVAAHVAALIRARSEQTGIDAAWVLRRLAAEAEADIADLYDEAGNLLHPKQWPPIWRKGLVNSVETLQAPTGETTEDGAPIYGTVKRVRLTDRLRHIELIGKHVRVGAFRDQVGVSAPDGGPVQVEDKSTARLAALLEKAASRGK